MACGQADYADVHCPTAVRVGRVLGMLARYHGHRVLNMERIPPSGPALVVVHHSFATYDIALLGLAIFEATGRLPRALVDRLFFKIPPAAALVQRLGSVQGEPAAATRLLERGELVVVAPGGMREALRPSSARYQLDWQDRHGFARLAVQQQVPIIAAACAGADDLFTLYNNPLSPYLLRRYHVPVPLLRGLGPLPLPRPRRLTHLLQGPLLPPVAAGSAVLREAQAAALAAEVRAQMEALLQQATQLAG